jgi:sugar phosphate permease
MLGSTPYLSELLIGNAAFAFLQHGVSWRWAFIGPGVLVFITGVVLYLSLREPPVGRFINKSKASAYHSALNVVSQNLGMLPVPW